MMLQPLALLLALLRAPGDSTVLLCALVLVVLLGVAAQDAGMLPSGMAPSPNTMPPRSVLLVSGWLGAWPVPATRAPSLHRCSLRSSAVEPRAEHSADTCPRPARSR